MADKLRKNTLMQLQVSLPKKILITTAIMAALILFVFYGNVPNPNMILIAGLVLCSALFGYGGGITAAVIMFGYTLFFFSTDHSFTQFTPQNMQKVIVSLIGIAADMLLVCELKRAEIREFRDVRELNAALQSEVASQNAIHEMLGSGKWSMDFDKEGVMVRVNWSDEFRRMLGYQSREDFPDVLESWSDLLHPDDKERVLKAFHDTLSDYTGQKIYDVEYRLLTKNRGYRWYRAVGKPVRRPDGSPVTYVGVFIDITERKETAQNLSEARRMADIDPLTGTKNKNAYIQWEKRINAAIEKGEQEPFAVAVFDINDLKKVNDLYGHKEGDACIRAACKKICTVFKHSPVFRVGGDEFIAILSGEDYRVRNELMHQINALPSDRSKVRLGGTVSAGMAEYDKDRHPSLLQVAEEADKAMYERKQRIKETSFPNVELSEDRDLIRRTERDKLTGLLNRDYFFRYVSRLDQIYKDTTLDAVVCDVNRFYAINQQYGRQFGDRLLSAIGAALRKLARQTGGIGCRQGGDTFLLYCPHQQDYASLLRQFTADVFADKEMADRVSLRFGVFVNAKREPDPEERFARASAAAERIKDDPDTVCGYDGET